MKALDALSEFNGFVAEHGKAIEHLTPEDAITLMIDFYRDVRAEDCSLEEDGDMLLSRGWNDTPNSMRGQTKWASHRAGSRPSYMNKGRYTRVWTTQNSNFEGANSPFGWFQSINPSTLP